MSALHLVKTYRIDLGLAAAACLASAAAGIAGHGALKGYSPTVAMAAPLIFTIAVLLFLTVVCSVPHTRGGRLAMRLLVDTAVMGLLVPMAFLKVEGFLAPYEYYKAANPAQVTAWIESDQDWSRFKAWARLQTMSRPDKEEVARALGAMLVSGSEAARHSAELTLNVPLRQFSLAALTVLTDDLKAYLSARAQTAPAPEQARLAGAFAAEFVGKNVGSIHKALDKEKRSQLPSGGLEALFLALAAEPTIGPVYLRELARHGDDTEKPLAESVLHLAAIGIPTT